jgi:hypothetical protein
MDDEIKLVFTLSIEDKSSSKLNVMFDLKLKIIYMRSTCVVHMVFKSILAKTIILWTLQRARLSTTPKGFYHASS